MEQGSLAAARIVSYGFLLLTAGGPVHSLVVDRKYLARHERIGLVVLMST
ncbi:MAG: hypothetical protein QM681_04290 [Novosphingobium sp.]